MIAAIRVAMDASASEGGALSRRRRAAASSVGATQQISVSAGVDLPIARGPAKAERAGSRDRSCGLVDAPLIVLCGPIAPVAVRPLVGHRAEAGLAGEPAVLYGDGGHFAEIDSRELKRRTGAEGVAHARSGSPLGSIRCDAAAHPRVRRVFRVEPAVRTRTVRTDPHRDVLDQRAPGYR